MNLQTKTIAAVFLGFGAGAVARSQVEGSAILRAVTAGAVAFIVAALLLAVLPSRKFAKDDRERAERLEK